MLYIRLRMNLTPFKSWKKWLVHQPVETLTELKDQDKIFLVNARQMVVLASRYHVIKANCLPKSLALKWLLNQYNIESELKLGLSLDKTDFKGHAWLVRGDLVLNDESKVAEKYPVEQRLNNKPLIN